MTVHSEFQEKIDVLDMIISILKEHEENLSGLVERFDALCNNLAAVDEKASELGHSLSRLEGLGVKNIVGISGTNGPLVTVECRDWLNFRSASQGALLVAFEIVNDLLVLSSVSDLFVFTYSERLPSMEALSKASKKEAEFHLGDRNFEASLSQSQGVLCKMFLKTDKMKHWLTSELGVAGNKIIEGRILR